MGACWGGGSRKGISADDSVRVHVGVGDHVRGLVLMGDYHHYPSLSPSFHTHTPFIPYI